MTSARVAHERGYRGAVDTTLGSYASALADLLDAESAHRGMSEVRTNRVIALSAAKERRAGDRKRNIITEGGSRED